MYEGEVTASGNDLTLAFGSFPASSLNINDEVDIYYGANAPTTRLVTGFIANNFLQYALGDADSGTGSTRDRGTNTFGPRLVQIGLRL